MEKSAFIQVINELLVDGIPETARHYINRAIIFYKDGESKSTRNLRYIQKLWDEYRNDPDIESVLWVLNHPQLHSIIEKRSNQILANIKFDDEHQTKLPPPASLR